MYWRVVTCIICSDIFMMVGSFRWMGSAPRKAHRDVSTVQGIVRGYKVTGPPHYAYFGIPYASPPTLRHRFEAPVPPRRWDGVFEAIHRVKCPQPSGGDENCLVLNIFAAEGASGAPVLVHIHGGGFRKGTALMGNYTRFIESSIVVVSVNYRIGALGFLCLGKPGAPGNAGLKDQVAALYWIQRNIENFGGNPFSVTLYGTEAGAASVEYLILSGLAKGLFHQAILEAGTATSPYSISYDPLYVALETAKYLGYSKNDDDIAELIKFYKKTRPGPLANITSTFLPCVEKDYISPNSFIVDDPLEILRSGSFHHVPILVAFSNEGGMSIIKDNFANWRGTLGSFFMDFLPENLHLEGEGYRRRIAKILEDFYVIGNDQDESLASSYVNYITDVGVRYPLIRSASLHAYFSPMPVYLMEFSNKWPNNCTSEVFLGDISRFLFSKDLPYAEEMVAIRLVTLWSNFIKYGDPTPIASTLTPEIWQPLVPGNKDVTTLKCLQFGRKMFMDYPTIREQLILWDKIYEKFYKNSISMT